GGEEEGGAGGDEGVRRVGEERRGEGLAGARRPEADGPALRAGAAAGERGGGRHPRRPGAEAEPGGGEGVQAAHRPGPRKAGPRNEGAGGEVGQRVRPGGVRPSSYRGIAPVHT